MRLKKLRVPDNQSGYSKDDHLYYRKFDDSWWLPECHENIRKYAPYCMNDEMKIDSFSLSKMANLIGISKEAVKTFLTRTGYLVPGTMNPTDAALSLGVSWEEGQRRNETFRYAVYKDNFAAFLVQHRVELKAIEKEENSRKRSRKDNDRPDSPQDDRFFNMPSQVISFYKKLGIPDSAVIIDTKTTGFRSTDEVIELGIIDLAGNVLYSGSFKPVEENDPAAKRPGEAAQKADPAPDFGQEIGVIMGILNGRAIIGHELGFDIYKIIYTAKLHADEAGESAMRMVFSEPKLQFDTAKIAKQYLKVSSYSLNTLCRMLGKEGEKQNTVDECEWIRWLIYMLETRPFSKITSRY